MKSIAIFLSVVALILVCIVLYDIMTNNNGKQSKVKRVSACYKGKRRCKDEHCKRIERCKYG